ncbi:Coatomer Subunit Delta [Manis pentadactyla]|nr:Coatomer Subunit Delta [Manis pentadactyla]
MMCSHSQRLNSIKRHDPSADGAPSLSSRDYDKLLIATISRSSLPEISAALWRPTNPPQALFTNLADNVLTHLRAC